MPNTNSYLVEKETVSVNKHGKVDMQGSLHIVVSAEIHHMDRGLTWETA